MNKPLFLKPVFQERIWGGTALRDKFNYEISTEHTGESWAISGHPNGQSVVKDGPYSGKTIRDLWTSNHDIFGNYPSDVFPLLTKVLDANKDLSVQVHPNDDYAKVNENGEFGKTECWYIIDCKEDAELVFGHTAQTKDEFIRQVDAENWNELLQRVKIKPGDFFYVPSGTIHALCEGTLVLEIQQNSDTTYRVYDYDRTDQSGNKRELHLKKAIEVTAVPHSNVEIELKYEVKPGAKLTTFVEAEYFSVYKWDINGKSTFVQDKSFMLFSILSGEGNIKVGNESYTIRKGDHFIMPSNIGEFILEGTMEIIVSHP